MRDYNRGRAAYFDGDYDRAEDYFNQAVQDLPTDPRPRKYSMARAAAAMRLGEAAGDDAKAAPFFTNALLDLDEANKQQSDGPTLALMGYCNSRVGNHQTALLWYDKAVAAGLTSAGLYNDRGFSHLELGQLSDAADDFDLALQSDPNLQPAIVNRALLILRQCGHANPPPLTDAMLADVKRAVETGPGSQELCVSAARVFATAAQAGRPDEPKTCAELTLFCLQKAVDCGVDPRDIEKNHTFVAVLKNFPEFQALMTAGPRPAAPMTLPGLVDPSTYLPE